MLCRCCRFFVLENNLKKKNLFDSVSIFGSSLLPPKSQFSTANIEPQPASKQKMINDFDSFLILENIDKTVKNRAVKINLKINALERNLSRIKEEYDLLKLLNLEKDVKRRNELAQFKDYLEQQLTSLKDERRRFGVWYFISGFFAEKIDYDALKSSFNNLKDEIRKYDKAAISFLKSKDPDLLPFKW